MPSSLRILIAVETYPPDVNGAARFAERLAGGLAGRGHDVHVVAPSPSGPPSQDRARRRHRARRALALATSCGRDFQVCMPWEVAPATAAVLEEIDPDVVHTQAHMVLGRYMVKAAARTGRPLVATNHFMPENLAAHAPVPRVLQRLGYRIAWKDLGRIFRHGRRGDRADPAGGRAAAALGGPARRVPRLLRHRRRPLPPRSRARRRPTCCSWAGWTRRSGSTS